MKHKIFLSIVFIFLQFLDLIFTEVGIKNGAYEVIPITRIIYSNLLSLYIMKIFVICLWFVLLRFKPPKVAIFLSILIIFLFVSWDTFQLIKNFGE